ncbi:di/tricarboxylate transporter [Sporomusaceae bacterium BoRhaA]|uniref:anion permease n=1 Tax=Pelorhabdus rhamnosifermentans TaxID=2772457 RepID=UPI001C05F00C|nr:anion permease [Pelorhabdus rhamnosifermentans]MBU2699628.1 di/tricarboxylate transporter [Pelorhabdus rhamnosifermentans]
MNTQSQQKRKTFCGFTTLQIAGLTLAACIWFIMTYVASPPVGLSKAGWAATEIMFMMIVIWITDALPSGLCAFLIVILLALTGATDWSSKNTPNTRILSALIGFSAKETWLIAAAFVLGMGLVESGLGRRVTYSIMSIKIFARYV